MPGQIVHYEIPAEDTAKGLEFWSSLFGWQFEQFPGPVEYHMARISESSGAAVTGTTAPGQRGPRAYFDVDDIDAGAARVKELGGEVDEKMPVPSMGWFVTCRDPSGNDFGLWQNDPSASMPES
jgi:predicted enzyme related to lactoylglutathione lyase